MNIYVDGVEYTVSMTWHPDDTLQHFVEINGEHVDLGITAIASRKDDGEAEDRDTWEVDHKAQRKMFEERIRQILGEKNVRTDQSLLHGLW